MASADDTTESINRGLNPLFCEHLLNLSLANWKGLRYH